MNDYSPKTWLALEIFAVICLDHVEIVIAFSDKSSKFNSFTCTLVVLDFHVFGGTNFHWWMKAIYFSSFYFRVFNSIRENKKPHENFYLYRRRSRQIFTDHRNCILGNKMPEYPKISCHTWMKMAECLSSLSPISMGETMQLSVEKLCDTIYDDVLFCFPSWI